jgi:heme-degrading monooxygenase HmoA
MNQRTNRPPEVPVKSGSVTLVNLFKVPPGESEQFLERWKDNARVMIGQPGFIRLRLLRSLIDDAEMRYINVAEWASGADLEPGYPNPEWQASVQRLLKDPDLHVTAQPRLRGRLGTASRRRSIVKEARAPAGTEPSRRSFPSEAKERRQSRCQTARRPSLSFLSGPAGARKDHPSEIEVRRDAAAAVAKSPNKL